jgi:hypothetical protein
MVQHPGYQELHNLMPRERSRDHENLAIVKLVPASIFRRPLQIGEADSRLHDLHTRHITPPTLGCHSSAILETEDLCARADCRLWFLRRLGHFMLAGSATRLDRGTMRPIRSPGMDSRSGSDLRPSLTRLNAIALVAGTIIGASIFVQPSEIAQHLSRPVDIMLVWLACGVLTLFLM